MFDEEFTCPACGGLCPPDLAVCTRIHTPTQVDAAIRDNQRFANYLRYGAKQTKLPLFQKQERVPLDQEELRIRREIRRVLS